ncbi:NADP-dependent phosphogluconate dehydrogenase, partial [Bacillus paramycoides]|nr:NADP-dependent phosphogluconate dehydrogenase [Bacillus paramycoides]
TQLKAASEEYDWNLDFGSISMLWRGGCIIRAAFLQNIKEAYEKNTDLPNLLLDPYFKEIVESYQGGLRQIISVAVQQGIPVPAFSAAISYYDSYRTATLPANLLQAQRDYFGAHTYKRVDKEGTFHTKWI